jgi:toxin ParE1/3/4
MRYKLSNKTERDLRLIYRYVQLKFGTIQADTYLTGLDETFELIADSPAIAQKVDDTRTGYQRYLYQEHSIYFIKKNKYIYIIRVLHQQMKVQLHLG